MIYRKEIDGLRALAVLSVILLHAGFEIFSGGYIGVDVFFVISGYLITSIIKDELTKGSFSLLSFYERRVRRILPALIFVSFVSVLIAWFSLTAEDMLLFSKSLIAVNLYVSNIFFYLNSGYFDVSNELSPLLHTWSLAVEEQYYLFAPLLLLALWKLGTKSISFVFFAISLLSLLAAQYLVHHDASSAFYLLHSRAWELGLGALVAMSTLAIDRRFTSASFKEVSSLLGLLLIITPIFTFTKQTDFPGFSALLPTFGAALIILFATSQTLVGRFLANRMLVGLGVVSYSAYLWHQPIFAFTRQITLNQPSVYFSCLLIVFTFILAFFTWKYVETPFRIKQKIKTKPFFMAMLYCTFILILFGEIGIYTEGYKFRYNTPQYIEASFKRSKNAKGCYNKNTNQISTKWTCRVGQPSENAQFFVVGDSHLVSMFDVLNKAAFDTKQSGYAAAYSGCSPLLGIHSLRDNQSVKSCYDFNNNVFEFVKKHHIKKVILVSRWSLYTDGNYFGKGLYYIGTNVSDKKTKAHSRLAFQFALKETAERYRKIGVKVIAVSQVPLQQYKAKYLFDKLFVTGTLNTSLLLQSSVSYQAHLKLQAFVNQSFKNTEGITYINLDRLFCKAQKCLIGDKNGSYYFDDNHLSVYGAKIYIDALKTILTSY